MTEEDEEEYRKKLLVVDFMKKIESDKFGITARLLVKTEVQLTIIVILMLHRIKVFLYRCYCTISVALIAICFKEVS